MSSRSEKERLHQENIRMRAVEAAVQIAKGQRESGFVGALSPEHVMQMAEKIVVFVEDE